MLAKAFERLRKSSLTRIEASKAAKQIQQTAPEATTGLDRSVGYAVGLVHVIVAIVLIDIYVTLVLRLFPATEELSGQYFEFVITPIIALWRSFTGYLPNAIEIIVLSLLTLLNCPVGNTLIHY